MSNFRSRDLLNLAYELDCTLKVPDVCTGGTGEPCHANLELWGKGGAMKAHDFAFASGCRACHRELDQGRDLSRAMRAYYWTRGHVETMRQLWTRGLLVVATEAKTLSDEATRSCPPTLKRKKRESKCTRSSKTLPNNWTRESAESSN